ncbi:grlE, partial [Symbiodinium sp. CCMP2592]
MRLHWLLCHGLVVWVQLAQRAACDIALGALAGWTAYEPEELIALIAAFLDYQKNWDVSLAARLGPPIVPIPGGVHANATRIALRIGTTHLEQEVGVATALDMMLGLDDEPPVVGLIGSTISSVTMAIVALNRGLSLQATVAGVRQVPQVSSTATSLALSNKDSYPFFLRTVAPDNIQALAMWSWILHFDVVLATCVYTTESYGLGLFSTLTEFAAKAKQQGRVQGVSLRYMPKNFIKEEARDVARAVQRMGSRFVFLLISNVREFLLILKEEKMLGAGWQVVGSDSSGSAADIRSLLPVGFMLFQSTSKGAKMQDFQYLWSRLEPGDMIGPAADAKYKLQKMRVQLDSQAVVDALSANPETLSGWAALMFDALYVFLLAINALLHKGVVESEMRGPLLLQEMLSLSFTGISGEVSFDENGDRMSAFDLLNVQVDRLSRFPTLIHAATFSASTRSFRIPKDLVWMNGQAQSRFPEELSACDVGFYKEEDSRQCKLCPKGMMCLGNNASFTPCPRGTYANETGLSNCTKCPEGHFAADVGSFECSALFSMLAQKNGPMLCFLGHCCLAFAEVLVFQGLRMHFVWQESDYGRERAYDVRKVWAARFSELAFGSVQKQSWAAVRSDEKGLNLLTAAAVAGQLLLAIQMLGTMRQLSIEWQDPVRQLLDLSRFITLDFDIIRLSCLYGADSAVLYFVSQLLACPASCAILLLTWLLMNAVGRAKPWDAVLNLCGSLLFAFFLSITLTTLVPFQCTSNPNGSSSMVTDPGIICYESEEHQAMVILAVLGMLGQPVAFLAWASYATLMYPSRIASGRGLRLVNRYRFFFHRFKPQNFYYGLTLLYRGALVALLPVLTMEVPELQVPAMGVVLLAGLVLQARTYPWRTVQANHMDLLLTALLLVILLGAAPLLSADLKKNSLVLGWLLCIPVLGLLLAGVLAILRALWKHLRSSCLFGVFLCHHKGGAGSLCRLMKILIAKHSSTRVFLDCDQLENLDLLFDIVKASTRSLVVVLTSELLKRVYCAGEITTAWKNKITTVPVLCDGFQPLTEEAQRLMPSWWTPQQRQILADFGIDIEDVHTAYTWLCDLNPVRMPRFGPVSSREDAVVEMLGRCRLLSMASKASQAATAAAAAAATALPLAPLGFREQGTGSKARLTGCARILIISSITEPESFSACEVFQIMLQDSLQVECVVVQGKRQMAKLKPCAYYLVVLLFRGIFGDATFSKLLLAAYTSPGQSLEVLTLIADPQFEFPSIESLSVAADGLDADPDDQLLQE